MARLPGPGQPEACSVKRLAIAAVTVAAFVSAEGAVATGLYQCLSGDRSTWQSPDDLKSRMLADGWQEVQRIKEDGNCHEAHGTTPTGQRVEAYFHPITSEKLLVARRREILFRKED